MSFERRLPIGAEYTPNGVHFRVFAPLCKKVEVSLEVTAQPTQFYELTSEGNGYFSQWLPNFTKNSLYRFRLNDAAELYSDPASRFQPEGPFGPSQVIDPHDFQWSDQEWKGLKLQGQFLYEMHIGTFTQEGTFAAAQRELQELANLGITIIEIMPLNDFGGKFGWGYDGVNLFAPTRLYGSPNDVKSFINEAHRLGIAVIIDVVYNHFGPEGNFVSFFSEDYHIDKHTDWGKAINFEKSEIREFFLTNGAYWIDEFHFDGLRVDATQNIYCTATPHVLKDLSQVAKKAGKGREIIVIGENEPQDANMLRPIEQGGYGFDGLWNDDFHHTAIVRLTGKREAYYTDYKGTPQEFISGLKYGFIYQGQYYTWQAKARGTSGLNLPQSSFVTFLQNHDQIANSGNGQRIHLLTDMGNLKAMTCLFLIAPSTPLLFQGQEFASSSPFLYFADHPEHVTKLVEEGRKESLSQFMNLATEEMQAKLAPPGNPDTFIKCKLNFTERETNKPIYLLHKDLIQLKKTDSVFNNPTTHFDGAVLNENAFLLRFFGENNNDRLILINFGTDFPLNPAPEPLLAPPNNSQWEALWSSEDVKYGGQGTPPLNEMPIWKLMGHSAVIYTNKLKF